MQASHGIDVLLGAMENDIEIGVLLTLFPAQFLSLVFCLESVDRLISSGNEVVAILS